eukprot:Nitzschia sp. Nitz4//scaffold78_size91513//54008//54379//NITZ4_004932-RA/size91513-snap-gene-0.124-mRNA-1//1//CDS//3329558139//1666//frame0
MSVVHKNSITTRELLTMAFFGKLRLSKAASLLLFFVMIVGMMQVSTAVEPEDSEPSVVKRTQTIPRGVVADDIPHSSASPDHHIHIWYCTS